jgi:hypothetical protein
MTRQDFRLIAETIKGMKLTNLARLHVAEEFADALAKRFPNFKREVFLETCGIPL